MRTAASIFLFAAALTSLGLTGCSDFLGSDSPVSGAVAGNNAADGLLDSAGDSLDSSGLGDWTPGQDLLELPSDTTDQDAGTTDISPLDAGGCQPACAPGYVCFGSTTPTCLPGPEFACAPCLSDLTCLGGSCSQVGAAKGCLIKCLTQDGTSSCPTGFNCTDGLCQPAGGDCSCIANLAGSKRSCDSGNGGKGACGGIEVCDGSAWSACSAASATTETCNNIDDNCDGQTDNGLAEQACGIGQCQGKSVCSAGKASCDGPKAGSEACNGLDDDCDGLTDEDFQDKSGNYNTITDCGSCGKTCSLDHAYPNCLVDPASGKYGCSFHCNSGYSLLNGTCVPFAQLLCQACQKDADCGSAGLCQAQSCWPRCNLAVCPGCEAQTPDLCPADLGCKKLYPDGTDDVYAQAVCPPPSGDCACTAAQAGLQKTCNNGPCKGIQVCDPSSGWSACNAASAQAEVCNGVDDDCDGVTDNVPGVNDPCKSANAFGNCSGKQVCTPLGLACDASAASPETCNGKDDNCDGQTDEGTTPDNLCAISNANGTCTGGWLCSGAQGLVCQAKTPEVEACNGIDDDCDGQTDPGWMNAQGLYNTPQACGSCSKICPQPQGANAMALCDGKVGVCAMACSPGWVDMDNSLEDGCECLFQGDLDMPDGVDQNCDGIDGDISKAIFVAKTGADSNPGTIDLPVATVAKAVSLAEMAGKRDVYVGGGVYAGSVDLAPGVSVYGGYGPGFSVRDTINFQSAVVATPAVIGPTFALRCSGIQGVGDKTRVDGLTILGAQAKAPGQSSYGLLAQGCDSRLQLVYNTITAGDGAAGLPGGGGLNGSVGSNGLSGQKAKDIGHDSCAKDDWNVGGQGSSHQCGANGNIDVSGGNGGTTVCPAFDEDNPPPQCPYYPYVQSINSAEPGAKGQGPGGATGGLPGADAYIDSYKGIITQCFSDKMGCNICHVPVKQMYGDDGGQGLDGQAGGGGPGCAQVKGNMQAGIWQPVSGDDGDGGDSGGGGGGGGAAGGVEVHDCTATSAAYSDLGGSGGGGGSGGCGGSGGKGGGSGGGSFAVFLVIAPGFGVPEMIGNTLTGGNGGQGGTGGPAGSGGPGGQGGKGGQSGENQTSTFCSAKGGNGGAGGNGGHGGGGGGGCGGPSVLLAIAGGPPGITTTLQKQNLAKSLGKGGFGGLGGPSIGNPGAAGQGGLSNAALEL